jgi:hypothetical protein
MWCLFVTGLRDTHRKNIKKYMKYLIWAVFISVLIMLIGFEGADHFAGNGASYNKEFSVAVSALFFSIIALGTSMFCSLVTHYAELSNYLTNDEIQHKKEEMKQSTESIELFYLPLQDLLTTYDESISGNSRKRKLVEINGHKHLAEPRVRSVFDRYIQSDEGANRESRKLLELVTIDIEFLQRRYSKRKNELNEE